MQITHTQYHGFTNTVLLDLLDVYFLKIEIRLTRFPSDHKHTEHKQTYGKSLNNYKTHTMFIPFTKRCIVIGTV